MVDRLREFREAVAAPAPVDGADLLYRWGELGEIVVEEHVAAEDAAAVVGTVAEEAAGEAGVAAAEIAAVEGVVAEVVAVAVAGIAAAGVVVVEDAAVAGTAAAGGAVAVGEAAVVVAAEEEVGFVFPLEGTVDKTLERTVLSSQAGHYVAT